MAIAGCSRTSLEVPCPDGFGQRAQPRCERAATDPPQLLLAEPTALEVLSAGCDIVAVLATNPAPALRVSLDGGMSFGTARSLPPDALLPNLGAPRFEPLAMAQDGALYVLSESAGGLRLHRSDDLGESWSEPVEIPASADPWGPSIVVREDEVAAYWVKFQQTSPWETWLAWSRDGGRSFEPPVRIASGRSAGASRPALCPAGEHGMLGGWLDCTGTDCSGDDRNGITLGMIAVSSGGQFSKDTLFELDNGVHAPIAGCFASGRALVAWSAAPYIGPEREVVVAAVLPCGITTETARFAGGRHPFAAPSSPIPVLGPSGALLYWRLDFNLGSGMAVIDSDGMLVSATLDPDLDADGAADVPLGACALPKGGYAMLTAGRNFLNGPVNAVAAFLAEDGTPASIRVLGPLDDPPAGGWVRCDGRGRAHFFWSGDGHARYASIQATP